MTTTEPVAPAQALQRRVYDELQQLLHNDGLDRFLIEDSDLHEDEVSGLILIMKDLTTSANVVELIMDVSMDPTHDHTDSWKLVRESSRGIMLSHQAAEYNADKDSPRFAHFREECEEDFQGVTPLLRTQHKIEAMMTYSDTELAQMTTSGDPEQLTTALAFHSLPDSLVEAMVTETADPRVVIALISRGPRVTLQQLEWAARISSDGVVLNRIIGHPNSSVELIRAVRDRVALVDDDVHSEMVIYANHLLRRRESKDDE